MRFMTAEFDERDIKKRILADHYNRLVFSKACGNPLFIVGGYLRDILRGTIGNPDRDYVAGGDYESLLHRVVEATGGKPVRLGGYLTRVVLRDKSTLDFSPLVNCISDDLSRRDFTINSLAWSPDTGIVDPYCGMRDIGARRIKMISKENIAGDPIRILRAYRFVGELSFEIERNTGAVMKELSRKIIETKSERVTLELFKILKLGAAGKVISRMSRDGIIQQLFTIKDRELRMKLIVLSRVERIFNALPLMHKERLRQSCPWGLSCLGMLLLEVLLDGVSASSLTLSSPMSKKLQVLAKANELLPDANGNWSHDDIFEAFSLLGEASLDFLILRDKTSLLSEYERFCAIDKRCLLGSRKIMSACLLLRGASLGRAIKIIKKAQFNGQISTVREALELLAGLCNNLT